MSRDSGEPWGQGRQGEQVTPGRRDVGKAGQGWWRVNSASERNYLSLHLPQFTHLNPGHNAFVKFKWCLFLKHLKHRGVTNTKKNLFRKINKIPQHFLKSEEQ